MNQRPATAELAAYRNEIVAALASAVFIALAKKSGLTESFARSALNWGKRVLTFDSPDNANLNSMDARTAGSASIQGMVRQESFLQ